MEAAFDQLIAGVEGEIDALRPEMAAARDRWLAEAAKFLARFWPEAAKEAVQENPAIARDQLGQAGVKALREEIEGLAGLAQELLTARTYLEAREIWPDEVPTLSLIGARPHPYDFYSHASSSDDHYAPTFLDEPFGRTAGLGGEVLASRGLPLAYPFEEERGQGGGASMRVIRTRHQTWPIEVAAAINAYGDLVVSLDKALTRLGELARERDKAEAGELWDQAGS